MKNHYIAPIKFLFVFLMLAFFPCIFLFEEKAVVFAVEYPYAQITNNSTLFYKSPEINDANALFVLEQTYFVKLLENEKNNFYKAEYMGVVGYVLKNNLRFVKGTPQKPFATNINFRVYAFEGLNLRSTPVNSEGPFNVITTVPFLETNLVYYGKTNGEEAIPNKGKIWYYCKYIVPATSKTEFGYLYSVFCDNLTKIEPNQEVLEEIEAPIFQPVSQENGGNALSNLSKVMQIIIVLGVSLPCLAIIYFLFKPTKIALDVGKNKKKIKKVKNSDYFEFED